jgi:hypothetical protein
MSLFTDSSLCLVPSGVKDGKLYSVKPTDGSGDLTFSRGSDIEATRVASNGYIQKAQVNLLLQSNSFDTTWTNTDTTETGGQTGYDGSNDAWLLTATSTSSTYVDQSLSTNSVVTLSVYAKANTADFIELVTIGGGLNPRAWFDLSTGSVGTSYNVIDTNIEAISSGWYRCSITLSGSITNYRFYATSADNSTSIGIGDSIYIQDAQVNYGLVAQEYQETTTTSVITGITNDMPRLDYSGGASCPSLLLEPSRQNLFPQSEYINALTFIQATATENADTSPEGVVNAARLYDNAVNAQHRVGETLSVTSGTTYTWSVFAKKGSLRYCYLLTTASGATDRYYFDLQDGVSITAGGKIEDYGNGWYRLSAQVTAAATGNEIFTFNLNDSPSGSTYTGTGTDYHSIYGFQCEAGSYPTSYLPTYGSSATRTSESCSKTGIASLIGQSEGTVFLEVDYSTLSGLDMFLSIRPNASNKVEVYRDGGTIYADLTASSSFALSALKAVGTHKIAFAYKSGSSALYIDGVLAGQSTTAFTFSASLANLYINQRSGGLFIEAANYKQVLLFTQRLSNSDLATLTTL